MNDDLARQVQSSNHFALDLYSVLAQAPGIGGEAAVGHEFSRVARTREREGLSIHLKALDSYVPEAPACRLLW